LNFGLPSPIDIQVMGRDQLADYHIAGEIADQLRQIPGAVDVHVQQMFDLPNLQRKFLNRSIWIWIATGSFATGCPRLLEVLLSGHDSSGVAELFGHLHLSQGHEFFHLDTRFWQQLIFDGTVDQDLCDAQAA